MFITPKPCDFGDGLYPWFYQITCCCCLICLKTIRNIVVFQFSYFILVHHKLLFCCFFRTFKILKQELDLIVCHRMVPPNQQPHGYLPQWSRSRSYPVEVSNGLGLSQFLRGHVLQFVPHMFPFNLTHSQPCNMQYICCFKPYNSPEVPMCVLCTYYIYKRENECLHHVGCDTVIPNSIAIPHF